MHKFALFGALALGLSSCTVTVGSTLGLAGSRSNLIAELRPDRGEGATYRVGEEVRFRITTRTPGYLTLVALQPGGVASTLVQGVYVQAGTTVFPRPQDGVTYNVAAPRGLQRVRAIFTRVRPTTELVFSGVYTEGRWNTATTTYVQPYAAADRDVQETSLYIR
ncbi:DUF4384 domain-containing protein [Deinococcus sp. MIMF12]|uniref:DUF4384 domain-containing protein n=1 Tax=Deinococcus rhizophilus TaxID=3049544 RepID=A0ABT7JEE3_9DEIO|nr:DUF4384 domain-containing protein [Deinococcus rhizophilus]MDL2343424.1 DUF4384 domain-containing protein [Deinococcus rhizophilus]